MHNNGDNNGEVFVCGCFAGGLVALFIIGVCLLLVNHVSIH